MKVLTNSPRRSAAVTHSLPSRCRRWIWATLAGAVVVWTALFAAVLDLANHVHVDIPAELAIRLPLLRSQPRLIFAGESRTEYGVDPRLAAAIDSKPDGYAVNIAYDAGEPLAFAAVAHRYPDVFRQAHVVISVGGFLFNEGVRSASIYPLDVAARLSVPAQLLTFMPARIGTLIRYVRETFDGRLAQQQGVARDASLPPNGGLVPLDGVAMTSYDIDRHSHFQGWDLSGPKARFALAALCDIAAASARLTVVLPPWIPGSRRSEAERTRHEDELAQLLRDAGARCGFEVLPIGDVPGLEPANYIDEMHLNRTGVPIYTRYLMSLLPR
jgi:hypothetical protein